LGAARIRGSFGACRDRGWRQFSTARPVRFQQEVFMTKNEQREERRLVKRAAAALLALAQFREKHALSGALGDIQTTLRINGWCEADAKQIARRMLAAGVTAWGARVMFAESTRVRQ
jgi:hypothetical protein